MMSDHAHALKRTSRQRLAGSSFSFAMEQPPWQGPRQANLQSLIDKQGWVQGCLRRREEIAEEK